MTSFQREEIEKVVVQIKNTGKLNDDKPSKQAVLEAQSFDDIISEVRSEKKEISKYYDEEIKAKIYEYIMNLNVHLSDISKNFNDKIMNIIHERCTTLDEQSKQRLLNALSLIPLLSSEIIDNLFNKSLVQELIYYAEKSLDDLSSVVSDYIYEKYVEILGGVLENLLSKKDPDIVETDGPAVKKRSSSKTHLKSKTRSSTNNKKRGKSKKKMIRNHQNQKEIQTIHKILIQVNYA